MSKQAVHQDQVIPRLGCKVFSATMHRDRDALGEVVTKWILERPEITVVEKVVSQSSDSQFHCLSIVLWYTEAVR